MKTYKRFKSYVANFRVSTASEVVSVSLATDINAPFTVTRVSGSNIKASSVYIIDSGTNRPWFNDNITGTLFIPDYTAALSRFAQGHINRTLPPNTVIDITITDDGSTYTAPYNGTLVFHGYEEISVADTFLLPEETVSLDKRFRIYAGNYVRAANQSQRVPLRIDRSRWFIIVGISASSTGSFNALFGDSMFGGDWSDGDIPYRAITGTAQYPFVLPTPVSFEKNTSLFLNLTDTSGSANTIQIAFFGYEVL